jgi:formylglycine-generating enzyme required for sulfatase activity
MPSTSCGSCRCLGPPYLFGAEPYRRPVDLRGFHMMSTPVTQALWTHIMGSNPSVQKHLAFRWRTCRGSTSMTWTERRALGEVLSDDSGADVTTTGTFIAPCGSVMESRRTRTMDASDFAWC